MRVNITQSKLETSTAKEIKYLMRKYEFKIKRVIQLTFDLYDFEIPFNEITHTVLYEKYSFYCEQYKKIFYYLHREDEKNVYQKWCDHTDQNKFLRKYQTLYYFKNNFNIKKTK